MLKWLQKLVSLCVVLTLLLSSFPLRLGAMPLDDEQPPPKAVLAPAAEETPGVPRRTLPNAPAAPEAEFTNSLALDGSGDYISVPHAAELNLDNLAGYTIEAWVRRNNGNRYEAIIGNNRLTSYWLGFAGPFISFYSGGSGTFVDGMTPVPADVWTHIAVVWNVSGNRYYYINGEEDYSGTPLGGPSTNSEQVYIGSDPAFPSSDYFDGNIAEVRVWNVPRTQNEIRRTMHVALDDPLPGLVANWHFNDGWQDNIGGHNGTAHGNADTGGPQAPPQPVIVPIDENFNTLPGARYGQAVAYVPNRNQALIIGGRYTSLVYAMDAGSGETTSLTSLPGQRGFATAAYVPTQDTIYLFGGSSTTIARDSILALDPDTGYDHTVPATFPVPYVNSAAVYHPTTDKVYVFGGGQSATSPYVITRTINTFDPDTETLTSTTGFRLPQARRSAAAAYSSATDKIYVFGGWDEAETPTDTIYRVTPPSGLDDGSVTTSPTDLPYPSHALVAVEDPKSKLIYLLGGSNNTRVIVFDPVTEEIWETAIEIEERTYAPAIYSGQNRHAVIIGGRNASMSTEDSIWRIPLGDGPAVPLGQWDFMYWPLWSNSNILSIDGDEDRILIGTETDGAIRLDGQGSGSLTHYDKTDLGSTSGRVHDVHYDVDNQWVWIATDDAGAQLFNGNNTSKIPLQIYDGTELGTDNTFSIDVKPGATDIGGSAFIGTFFNGLWWQYGTSSLTWKNNFAGQSVANIEHRGPQDLWATSSASLQRLVYNPSTGSATETSYSGSSCSFTTVSDFTFDAYDNWWIASQGDEFTTGGVCFVPAAITPGSGTQWTPRTPIGNRALDIDVDADGRAWVAFDDENNEQSGGLTVWETENTTAVRARVEDYNWDNAPIGSLISDTTGATPIWKSGVSAVGAADERVWFGTNAPNLMSVSQRWRQFEEDNNLEDHIIQRLWTVRGRLFLGRENGLHILLPDGKTWDNRIGLTPNVVLGDSQGRIWVGAEDGVRHYTDSGWDMLADAVGTPPTSTVHALAEDADGRIWIGSEDGLTLYDRERFVTTFNTTNSTLPTDTVKALLVDNRNRLWVGTLAGLVRIDDDASAWTLYTTSDGLAGNEIYDLAQQGSGQLAITSDGGLSVFREDMFAFETLSPPVNADDAPLTVDELGRLWVGSAARTGTSWQGYYWTNSGLRTSRISDNAADGADRVWFSHAPATGISVRGAFLPPLGNTIPVIDSVTPALATSGDPVQINGSGFGDNASDVRVTIGGTLAEVTDVRDTRISVLLNDNNVSGDVVVSVDGRQTTWGSGSFCAIPQVHNISPTGGNAGVMININGSNFDPSAQVIIGTLGSPHPVATRRTPTRIEVIIQETDGNGQVYVSNPCHASAVDNSDETLRRISLDIADIFMNQGVESYGIIPGKATMIQNYVTYAGTLRDTDLLHIDTISVTLTAGSQSASYELPYVGAVPAWQSFEDVTRQDIINTVNAFLIPEIDATEVNVQTALINRGVTVAQHTKTFEFLPEFPITVLLVPIMPNAYSGADLYGMMGNVGVGLSESEWRMPLTGRVRFVWSPMVLSLSEPIEIGSSWDLYVHSHGLDEARRIWNENNELDALIAFGIVHDDIATGVPGFAFWPDVSELINLLLLAPLNFACEVTSFAVRLLTFGMLGFEDSCQLEIPLYVGLANGHQGADGMAALITHELGHVQGLVKPEAPNYYRRGIDNFDGDTDNPTHSLYDEVDVAFCGDVNEHSYTPLKTFYNSPGVQGPVVNPLQEMQLYPQLNVTRTIGTVTSEAFTERAKAMMSYACRGMNYNSFYEPVDALGIYASFGATSAMSFFSDLMTGGRSRATATTLSTTSDGPTPIARPGTRIHVSGIVTKSNNSGSLVNVQVLGENAPLSAEFATGYWLVQLDDAQTELARTGLYPNFSAVASYGDIVENDAGFFATTLLAESDVTRIELRHDDTVLDVFEAGTSTPVVNITSAISGTYNSGNITISWTASDTDGDDLEILIDYSMDGGTNWMAMVFSNDDNGSVEIPVYQLGGSGDARFRVTASDGMNSASAMSGAFSVANQPPRPYIGNPGTGSTFLEGTQIALFGGAYDNQDGEVADEALYWVSDRDGYLGRGNGLIVHLSAGPHTVGLIAYNSVGFPAVESITVTIEGDYDYDGLPDTEESTADLNPLSLSDGYSDADGDNLPLVSERHFGTNPNSEDSDGDGRSDGDEILDGTDPATADDPLPADALDVTPAGLNFEADLSLDTPLPQQSVHIVSRAPATWTLTADVPWLTANAITDTTPSAPTLLVKAFEMETGVHTGILTVTSDALGSVVTVPVTATITNADAYFDTNDDDCINVGDVQGVAGDIPGVHTDPDFDYRRDIDQDADIDTSDATAIAQRWGSARGTCSTTYPSTTAQIQVDAPISATVGDTFDVDVRINGAATLGGFEFDLDFDPAIVQVQSINLGAMLSSTGRNASALGAVIDNNAGTVAFGGYSSGTEAGATGSGILATLSFQAVMSGTVTLDIQNPLLADPGGNVSVPSAMDADVMVQPGIRRIYLPLIVRLQ